MVGHMSSGRLSQFLHNPLAKPWARQRSERDSWPEAVATVADCLALSGSWDKGRPTAALYSVRFIYWVDGEMHTGCFKTRMKYSPGDTLTVRYDPVRPERNSTDPVERLRTELLIAAAVGLVALYIAIAWHF
jgi:hypothetical protein